MLAWKRTQNDDDDMETKLLLINNQQKGSVTVTEKSIIDVDDFVYLGNKISKTGVTDEDIKARVKKARQAFAILRPVWRATASPTKLNFKSSTPT